MLQPVRHQPQMFDTFGPNGLPIGSSRHVSSAPPPAVHQAVPVEDRVDRADRRQVRASVLLAQFLAVRGRSGGGILRDQRRYGDSMRVGRPREPRHAQDQPGHGGYNGGVVDEIELPRDFRAVLVGAATVLAVGILSSCAFRPADRNDYGVLRCPIGAAQELVSASALQRWFDGSHGRWRTVSHDSHYDVLVVHVEVLDLRDADEIARRFVLGESTTFSEILIYAQPESLTVSLQVRRVRWTREAGFETLDFAASPAR